MRCVSALLLTASLAAAAGINTDAAQPIGKGEVASVTRLRYQDLENDVERYLAQQTLVYGVYKRLALLTTIGYEWNSPGEDGATDLSVRGRFTFYFNNRGKRQALSFAFLLGGEIPIGEEPIGSPDGGLITGLVFTWEKSGWRIDADAIGIFRPNANDKRRADVAIVRELAIDDYRIWLGVLEFNFERNGDNDVLFISPGIVYEFRGWKIEASFQINAIEDARGPVPDFAVVFAVVHVF